MASTDINDPRPVLRQELSRVFQNQRVVRAFEKIFDLVPPQFINQQIQIDTLSLIAELGASQSTESLSAINRLVAAVETLAAAPAVNGDDFVLNRFQLLEARPSEHIAIAYPHLEQGSWTPSDASGAGLAFAVADGHYIKHEDLVLARFRITYPVTASGVANLVTGLPFTLNASEVNRQGFLTFQNTGAGLQVLPALSTTNFNFRGLAGGAVTNAALSAITLFGTVIYMTA